MAVHEHVCVWQHLNELKKKVARGRNLRVFWVNCHDVCALTIDSCDAVYTSISIFLCNFFFNENKGHLNYLLEQTMARKRMTTKRSKDKGEQISPHL